MASAKYFTNQRRQEGLDMRDSIKRATNNLHKDLEDFYNTHRFDEQEYSKISPAFMWAQSKTHVFLLVKYAHRHDTPGCLEVKNEQISVNDDVFKLSALCIIGDVPLKFELNILLYASVKSDESTWSSGSVGRLQINLKKNNANNYWRHLYKMPELAPDNMRVWIEMKEKHKEGMETEMEESEEELEREKEIRESAGRKKRRRVKKRSSSGSEGEQATESKDEL